MCDNDDDGDFIMEIIIIIVRANNNCFNSPSPLNNCIIKNGKINDPLFQMLKRLLHCSFVLLSSTS